MVAEDGLITAAHCLYDKEKKTWADRIMFCLAFSNGYANDTYGSWVYREYAVPKAWLEKGDYASRAYDVGFIKLRLGTKIHGQIGHVVRQLPLLVDMEPVEDTTTWLSVGYPAIKIPGYDFDGENMWQCSGAFCDKWEIEVNGKEGNLTPGASGGPWLFERPKGYYAVNGINSSVSPSKTQNYASYFGKWVEEFFTWYFG